MSPSLMNRPCTAVLVSAASVVLLMYCNHFSNYGGGSAAAQDFAYPGQAKSERDLSTCEPYEICSIVHKRYWFTNKVERLCRCDRQECSSSWTDWTNTADADAPYTMMMNNRAQMKFCEPVTALPNCLEIMANSSSASGQNNTRPPMAQQRFLNVINDTRTEIISNATVQNYKLSSKAQCYCPPQHQWIAHAFQKNETLGTVSHSYTRNSFRCSELPKCKANDVCGFERADLYSIYYKCSCPVGHMCTRQNQPVTLQINELLYEGPAYVTHCQSKKNI